MFPAQEIRIIRIMLHTALVILLLLLFTQRLWVMPLVNYIVVHFYGIDPQYLE